MLDHNGNETERHHFVRSDIHPGREGYYVTRAASAHLHKGERRLLSIPDYRASCTHSPSMETSPCGWCGAAAGSYVEGVRGLST